MHARPYVHWRLQLSNTNAILIPFDFRLRKFHFVLEM